MNKERATSAGLALSVLWLAAIVPANAQEQRSCLEDAMIVFDASKSMDASDGNTSGLRRIDSVRGALAKVLPRVARERRLGLMTYGPGKSPDSCANVTLDLPPAPNTAGPIMARINALRPDGRTPLTTAVRMAAETLAYWRKPVTIVLVTDGEESCRGDPCALARELKTDGVRVTVHIISYKVKDSLGSDEVFHSQCLPDTTGGLYVATETLDELVAALNRTLVCPMISDARGHR
jgi:Ca-activated chloride channel homolog